MYIYKAPFFFPFQFIFITSLSLFHSHFFFKILQLPYIHIAITTMTLPSPTSTCNNDSVTSERFSSTVDRRHSSLNTDYSMLDYEDIHSSSYQTNNDTDSDKDLIIHSLNESLHIHKEILEKIQAEKEAYVAKLDRERKQELEQIENTKQYLEEQMDRYNRLDAAYHSLQQELTHKKEDYQRMEAKFYAQVKSIKATDDDLSTIQNEINHVSSQLNNICMGLKSKMDFESGTAYFMERYHYDKDLIEQYLLVNHSSHQKDLKKENNNHNHNHSDTNDSEEEVVVKEEEDNNHRNNENEMKFLLESRHITMFTEKLIMEMLIEYIYNQPLHIGVSCNEAYDKVYNWMNTYNLEWANRFRQQMSALVVNQAYHDEYETVEMAKEKLVDDILEQLSYIYPTINQNEDYRNSQQKKISNVVTRAARLNLAMKGQEIPVRYKTIDQGCKIPFDSTFMKPVSKSKPDGYVLFVISPPFIAIDPKDDEHGFVIPGKVYCV
ncbi:unnamed protein product [Cunninghamella blakesleeana]